MAMGCSGWFYKTQSSVVPAAATIHKGEIPGFHFRARSRQRLWSVSGPDPGETRMAFHPQPAENGHHHRRLCAALAAKWKTDEESKRWYPKASCTETLNFITTWMHFLTQCTKVPLTAKTLVKDTQGHWIYWIISFWTLSGALLNLAVLKYKN